MLLGALSGMMQAAAIPQRIRLSNRVVVVVDIVESVRLIKADEMGTITRWLDLVAQFENEILGNHFGRVVKSLGDGILVEFPDVRSAVAAALSIHSTTETQEKELDPDNRILLRIGIEVSDLIVDSRDVYGHGVNMAARLAGLAGPGQTVVSANVRDQLTPEVDADVEDLGECFVKHLEDPIRAYRIGKAVPRRRTARVPLRDSLRPTLAIIPFQTRDPEAADHVLGEILADGLIAHMSRTSTLNVISRLSTTGFRDRHQNKTEIFDLLNAHYILSGTYLLVSGELVLQAELTVGETSAVIWSERFSVRHGDTQWHHPELIEEIAGRIASSIVIRELRTARLLPLPTLHMHTLLLAAIALLHRQTPQDFNLARDLLTELIERNPRHPIPRAWMAQWQVFRVHQGWSADAKRDGLIARDEARRALDSDPECDLALVVDGQVNTHFLKRLDNAMDSYQKAVEVNPNSSFAWLVKGTLHAFTGEGQIAVDNTERGLGLSPLDPHRYYYDSLAASACLSAGENERALELTERSLRANRRHFSTLRVKLAAQWRLGQHEAAQDTGAELMRLDPGMTISGWLARTPSANYEIGREIADIMRSVGIPD